MNVEAPNSAGQKNYKALRNIIANAVRCGEVWSEGLRGRIDKLWHDDIRVHDKKTGGVLWVHGRKRETEEPGQALKEEKKTYWAIVDDKGLAGEVALSRAMFNRRVLPTNQGDFLAISFEAPLVRMLPKKQRKNKDDETHNRSSRTVACDLVCLNSEPPWRLVAVEVKSQGGDATNLDYGLLEARAYGHLLRRMVADHSELLIAQIKSALKRYHPGKPKAEPNDEIKIEYALAAPDFYFREQAADKKMMCRVEDILRSFKDEPWPKFSGFWVLSGGGDVPALIDKIGYQPPGQTGDKSFSIPCLKNAVRIDIRDAPPVG